MPEIPKGFYIKKNGKWVRRITLAQVQIEFQKKPFQKTPKDIETIKKLLIEYAEQNLPPNERRKMSARVKNVKTKKDLEEAIELAEKYAEQHYKRTSGKKKQTEPLSEKELKNLEELREKTRQKIIFGDIKRITKFDKYFVQEIDEDSPNAAEVLKKSQYAYLLTESAYIANHLERLVEEKPDFVITGWYKLAEKAFTSRLEPIQKIYKDVEGVLAKRLSKLRGDFNTGYKNLYAVAEQCDIDRIKSIRNFQSVAKEFHKTIYAIYEESFIELNTLIKQASVKLTNPKGRRITKEKKQIANKICEFIKINSRKIPDAKRWVFLVDKFSFPYGGKKDRRGEALKTYLKRHHPEAYKHLQ